MNYKNIISQEKLKKLSNLIISWYRLYGRKNLPWKKDITIYKIWVSEIMLQQTQVITVIPYFKRFLKKFPTILDLAKASEDQVLHLWTGLGFYRRAKNMHKTAKYIIENYDGKFPKSFSKIINLPGIGRSTAGAILSFSFNKNFPILDGNVIRVLSRIYGIHAYPLRKKTNEFFWDLSTKLTPFYFSREYNQGIIDLGATICLPKNPKCTLCPLKSFCSGFLFNTWKNFPGKKKKNISHEKIFFCVAKKNNIFLLEKKSSKGIWGSLYSFPQFKNRESLIKYIKFNFNIIKLYELNPLNHQLSHIKLVIYPFVLEFKKIITKNLSTKNFFLYDLLKSPEIGLASPIKHILFNFKKLKIKKILKKDNCYE